jgi:hypothetical protein
MTRKGAGTSFGSFTADGPRPTKALAWLSVNGHLPGDRTLGGCRTQASGNGDASRMSSARKPETELSVKTEPVRLDAAQINMVVHARR